MIAEIIPEAYDAKGHQVSQPFHGRKNFHPTFPFGRYVSQPLGLQCRNLEEMRQFLCKCRAVSDEKLFGKKDYWQPPEEFEKRQAGDCEDFSFWTWRQLLNMGFDARIVFGRSSRYGIGHAWTMFFENGKCFLLEPQAAPLGLKLPRLSTARYEPKYSVAWDGNDLRYYAHKSDAKFHISLTVAITLLPEWCRIWGWFWARVAVRLPIALSRKAWMAVSKKRPPQIERL